MTTIATLEQEARTEITQFLRDHHKAGHASALELFRRAIVERDEQAWEALYSLYHAVVESWIQRRNISIAGDDVAGLVNEAFARFFRSIRPARFEEFGNVSALMGYLKCCALSATVDYVRAQNHHQKAESLDELGDMPTVADMAETVVNRLTTVMLWQALFASLNSEQERIVMAETLRGWMPADIAHQHPLLFSDVAVVYQIKHNMQHRLRRNQTLLQLRSEVNA